MNTDSPIVARVLFFIGLGIIFIVSLTNGLLVGLAATFCLMLGVLATIAYHYEVGLQDHDEKQKNREEA